MPFALIVIGILMIVTGSNGTYRQFGAQLQKDFTGEKGFITWAMALIVIGLLGYINRLRELSHYFMALIIIVMIIRNGGFFDEFMKAMKSGPVAPKEAPADAPQKTGISTPDGGLGNLSTPFGNSGTSVGKAWEWGKNLLPMMY